MLKSKYAVLSAGMDLRLNTGRTAKIQAGQGLEVQARKHIAVGAGEEISIKTGSASITTKKDGDVAIKGKDVNIEATGKMTAKQLGKWSSKAARYRKIEWESTQVATTGYGAVAGGC